MNCQNIQKNTNNNQTAYELKMCHKNSSNQQGEEKHLKESSGHIKYEALQSTTPLGAEKEILINMILLLVSKGELSENEGNKVQQLIANDKGRRL